MNDEFRALVEKGMIEESEYNTFRDDILQMVGTGQYFYIFGENYNGVY